MAERCIASIEVIVSAAGALVEDAVGRTGIVGVVTLLRDVAGQIGTSVDQVEITDIALNRPRRVRVGVIVVLRRKQRCRIAFQRLVIVGVSLGREGTT